MSDQPYRNPKVIYKGIIRCMALAYKKGKLDSLIESEDLDKNAIGIQNANKEMLDEYLRIDGNIREALDKFRKSQTERVLQNPDPRDP